MRKDLIKQRFSKCLKTYDNNASVQKKMAEILVSLVEKKDIDAVLELGCGTGLLTKKLTQKIRFKTYTAIDMVKECENYIRNISEKIEFIPDDIENFKSGKKYDLIISNASVQWVEDMESFLKNIKNLLSDNGIFIFSTFGKNNFKELKIFIKTPLEYYSMEELTQKLSDFEIIKMEEDIISLEFNSPKEVLKHIKNTGVNALSQTIWTKSDLINFEKNYPQTNQEKFSLTYNPVYIKTRAI